MAEYVYLGLSRIVQTSYDEPSVEMTLIGSPPGDGGDQYIGLDRFGRTVNVNWLNSASASIEQVLYGYNQASNRQSRQNPVAVTGQDQYYTYDGLYQINQLQQGTLNSSYTGISGVPSWQENFLYDPTGNWTNYQTAVSGSTTLNQDRTHNDANEILSISESASLVGYDAAGNMTSTPQPDNWSSAYGLKYDAWNRLVDVSDGNTEVAAYAYDGFRRRIQKSGSGETNVYYYSDQWQILEERASSDETITQFFWGLRDVDDLIQRNQIAGETTTSIYALRDAMHVTAITDSAGNVLERYSYNAFGITNVLSPSFAPEDASTYDWETRFSSYYWDAESGFYQVRHRYVHPSIGRWLSHDPVGESEGINIHYPEIGISPAFDGNLYKYVNNNPVNLTDPTGLVPVPCSIGLQVFCITVCAAQGKLSGGCYMDIEIIGIFPDLIVHITLECDCCLSADAPPGRN